MDDTDFKAAKEQLLTNYIKDSFTGGTIMTVFLSHFSHGVIAFVAALTVITLLFAVFPKTAWTKGYSAAEQTSGSADPIGISDSTISTLDAPLIGISDIPVTVDMPLPLSMLLTANGRQICASEERYYATLNECVWLGSDGDHPSEATIIYADGQITFPEAGIYRLKVTVSDREGLKSTAYLYAHASRKGGL